MQLSLGLSLSSVAARGQGGGVPTGYLALTNKTGSLRLTNKNGSTVLLGKAA